VIAARHLTLARFAWTFVDRYDSHASLSMQFLGPIHLFVEGSNPRTVYGCFYTFRCINEKIFGSNEYHVISI